MKIRETIADWITGGALSEARQGRKENWTEAQSNWRLATERLAKIESADAHLRQAEADARATAQKHRQQMDQIRAELSELIEEKPMSAMATKLRTIRALTKG